MLFKDDYKWLSGWIHDYYCDKDGSELIFDISNSNYFECPICHCKKKKKKRKRAWVTKYRYKVFSELEKYSIEYITSKNDKYLTFIKYVLNYYSKNYDKFPIHNKTGKIYNNYFNESNKCGKITAQGLNEAMISIQIANCINNINKYLNEDTKTLVFNKMFNEIYKLLKPQINKIHNIDCYEICAIGIMGILSKNNEMINYAFNSDYSFYKQLEKGVTKDNFWYEGSFHYHLFVLKPILQLLIIAKRHSFKVSQKYYNIAKEMLIQCFKSCFNDCTLPSPNDGWPNRELENYIEVYRLGNDLFENEIQNIINCINYKNNTTGSNHLFDTGFSILKNKFWDVFTKYGDNDINHAHPDKLNIEIKLGNNFLSHDLSTSGYGSSISKEYYKKTYSHNTIVLDGKDQNLNIKGTIKEYSDNFICANIKNLYNNVDVSRKIELISNNLIDDVKIKYNGDGNIDYILHCDAQLITNFEYKTRDPFIEYPYFKNIEEVISKSDNILLKWKLNDKTIDSAIDLKGKILFICSSPDNPDIKHRTTLIIRSNKKNNIFFNVSWKAN